MISQPIEAHGRLWIGYVDGLTELVLHSWTALFGRAFEQQSGFVVLVDRASL